MSIYLLLGLIALCEIAVGIIYGLCLHPYITNELFLLVAFILSVSLLFTLWKNHQSKPLIKIIEVLALSLPLFVIAPMTYDLGNRLSGKMVAQYDVVVESVYGRGGGSAEFTTPDGRWATVDLGDYRVILTDEDDYVEVGDTIRVQEYCGLFKQSYYVLVGEIHE